VADGRVAGGGLDGRGNPEPLSAGGGNDTGEVVSDLVLDAA